MQCGAPYSGLLQAWAGSRLRVCESEIPRTDCAVGAAADKADLAKQPADTSYALSRLLELNGQAKPGGWFSNCLKPNQIVLYKANAAGTLYYLVCPARTTPSHTGART